MSVNVLIERLASLYSDLDALVMRSEDAAALALIEKDLRFYGRQMLALADQADVKCVEAPLD